MAAWGVDVRSSSTALMLQYQKAGCSDIQNVVTQVVSVLQAVVF